MRVFDCDNHMYEPPEAITEYLPARHRGAIEFVQLRGRTKIVLQGRIVSAIPNPTFEYVAAPGSHAAFYSATNQAGLTLREMGGEPIRSIPAFREPAPRLELLDQLEIDHTLMFPTLANLVEQFMHGPDLVHDVIHGLNQWMHEVWSFDYVGRIFPTPVIHLGLVDRAVAELEWVLDRGARVIDVRPAPVTGYQGSRSVGLPEFDPFWARVEESGIVVAIHATETVLRDYVGLWEPRDPGNAENTFKPTAFRMMAVGHRDMEDMVSALICHGALSRFPGLRVVSVENGAEWVGHLITGLNRVYGQIPQDFTEHPVEVFRRNVWVAPFWEDDVGELADRVGIDHVVFGSDYPHPEGLAVPLDFLQRLDGLDDDAISKVMFDNMHALLQLT